MSFFTEIYPDSSESTESSNVFGATGLSRSVLAAMFRSRGLFGRESDLTPAEQAVVQSRLPAIKGLPSRPTLAPLDARLLALSAFTDVAVRSGGRLAGRDQAQLVAAGFSSGAVSEVLRVVRDVRDVFGLVPRAKEADARVDTVAQLPWARAA